MAESDLSTSFIGHESQGLVLQGIPRTQGHSKPVWNTPVLYYCWIQDRILLAGCLLVSRMHWCFLQMKKTTYGLSPLLLPALCSQEHENSWQACALLQVFCLWSHVWPWNVTEDPGRLDRKAHHEILSFNPPITGQVMLQPLLEAKVQWYVGMWTFTRFQTISELLDIALTFQATLPQVPW